MSKSAASPSLVNTRGSRNIRDGQGLRFAFLEEPPFCFRASDGTIAGCDVELARLVAQRIGAEPFVPIETEFAQLLPGLADGQWDMTTGLFVTEARQRIAAFSRPIWRLGDGLLIRSDDRRLIESYSSIAAAPRMRLAVVRDQVQHQTALGLGVGAERIVTLGAYAEAAAAVASGAVDAFASVASAHRAHLMRRDERGLAIVDIPEREKNADRGAFAFAIEAREFRDAVDEALTDILGSAAHLAMMARYGFSAEDVERVAPGNRWSGVERSERLEGE
jgi:polar amino acid transport system substrate-binding protein